MTVHVGGRGFAHTCRESHKGNVTGGGGATLTAPTLTLTSATGATPEWDTAIAADTFAGYYLRVQSSADGVKGGDGSYTTTTNNIQHTITAPDIAAGIITHAELVSDGWADVSGTWRIHARIEREDGTVSAWSNELTGTVTGSAAELATVTGVNKNTAITVTGAPAVNVSDTASTGAYNGVRSSIGKSGKGHFEVTLTGGSSGDTNGTLWIGLTDASTMDFNAGHTVPGNAAGLPGCSFRLKIGGTGLQPYINGATGTAATWPVAPAVGDKYALEFDTAAGTVTVYQCPVSTGTWTLAHAAYTMTSQIPVGNYFAHVGLAYTDATCVANFGASAFSMTPTTGYSGW